MTPRRRRRVLATVMALLGLPALLAGMEAVSFYVRNRENGSIVSSGERRDFVLYVPATYDRARPTPLVISLHGAGLWGAAQREISQWNAVADQYGFIVVYPSGESGRGPRIWRAEGGADQETDVRFIADLIDTLAAHYSIDRTRVYANGLSNGGGMTFVLSCYLSDRIAAVGVVAPALFLPWSECPGHRPVPMIAFQGTADRIIPYHGGRTWVAPVSFPDIPTWVAAWAGRNSCPRSGADSVVAADVTRHVYTACADNADVVLYTILGGGHTWPGGMPLPEWFVGATSHGISATREMWAFFRQHRLTLKAVALRDSLSR